MKILIDTIENTCEVAFHPEDKNKIQNLLLLKQASSMANPDSRFSIHFNEGWEVGHLGELETLAKEIAFDIAMKHGDVEITGPPEITREIDRFRMDALDGTDI